jgi:hypothetical protein
MRGLSLLAALPLLAGCGGSSGPAATGEGVLFGTVVRAPGGACPSQAPCSIPASGLTLHFTGPTEVQVKTGAKGAYRVRLPAGRYAVAGPQPLKPMHVEVEPGDSRRVDFSTDTKIS